MKTLFTALLSLIVTSSNAKLQLSLFGGAALQSKPIEQSHKMFAPGVSPCLTHVIGGSIGVGYKKWDFGISLTNYNVSYSNNNFTFFVCKPAYNISLLANRHFGILYTGATAGYISNNTKEATLYDYKGGKAINMSAGNGYTIGLHIGVSPKLSKQLRAFVQAQGAYNNIDMPGYYTDINAKPIKSRAYFFSYGATAGLTLSI